MWRETDHRSPPDQICSIFNAKWHQGLQLQKACGYLNMSCLLSCNGLNLVMCCPRMTSAIIRLILLLTENVTIVGVQVFISLLYYSSLKSSKFKLATLNVIVKTCFITQTKQNLYLHCFFFVCKKCIMLGIKFVLFCF